MKKELIYLDLLTIFAMLGQLLILLKISELLNFNIAGILGYFIGLAVYAGDLYMYFKIKKLCE